MKAEYKNNTNEYQVVVNTNEVKCQGTLKECQKVYNSLEIGVYGVISILEPGEVESVDYDNTKIDLNEELTEEHKNIMREMGFDVL